MRAVSGKLSELEVELQRSQRSIDIPLVKLEINRQIAAVCMTVRTVLFFFLFFFFSLSFSFFFYFFDSVLKINSFA